MFLNSRLLHCRLFRNLLFISTILDSSLCILNGKSSPHLDRSRYYAVLCLMVQLHSDVISSTLKIQFQHNFCLVWTFFHFTVQRKALQWCTKCTQMAAEIDELFGGEIEPLPCSIKYYTEKVPSKHRGQCLWLCVG